MNIDSNIIIAIISVVALISPMITAHMNNKHQLKLKKIEMFEIAKRNSLEKYIKCASKCRLNANNSQTDEYYESLNDLYLYFSKIPDTANNLLMYKGTNFTNELSNIIKILSIQISKE